MKFQDKRRLFDGWKELNSDHDCDGVKVTKRRGFGRKRKPNFTVSQRAKIHCEIINLLFTSNHEYCSSLTL